MLKIGVTRDRLQAKIVGVIFVRAFPDARRLIFIFSAHLKQAFRQSKRQGADRLVGCPLPIY